VAPPVSSLKSKGEHGFWIRLNRLVVRPIELASGLQA